MDDSGAILSHISSLKDMLDQIETALAVKESELTKMLFISQFEIIGFQSVTVDSRKSMKVLEDELSNLKTKRDDILKRMNKKRECFTALCLEFQRDIGEGKNDELVNLSSEKESLENEVHMLGEKINTMQNVMLVFEEEILEDLHKSNSAVHFEIQNDKQENEILLKDIENLRSTLLHYYDSS
ncbi:uncharacterized protein LOC123204784 isoform X2 [Mangifera indica]|uniref:uncharacterized protein LOC123204784 isoform X2 n=1 Tax=Mangifera indica TaxID=29780 RepID=UPI001CFB93DE|nr:uncharacterized protein LOC123204784 isoform X2 [Mangifera indica]